MLRLTLFLLQISLFIGTAMAPAVAAADGDDPTIQFNVNDSAGFALPCRIHLADSDNKLAKPKGLPYWNDHFLCNGRGVAIGPPGRYTWEIERGPEYERVTGTIDVASGQTETVNVTLSRIANLREKGWYSGDLHVHRSASEIPILMQAEDLDFAPVIEWWNASGRNLKATAQTEHVFDGRRYQLRGGEDEREGGALLYFGLNAPLDIRSESREFPSPMKFVSDARAVNSDVWIDIEKPFWWDVPTWLASGRMNSIGIANNHMCRNEMLANEAWGKPRDATRLPGRVGNGYWSQEIYYHALNCGFRLPPSAGSASGVLPNHVGYNRVYVHLHDEEFTGDSWFDGLSKGRCFVTNGPLLRVTADSALPGEVFEASDKQTRRVKLNIALTSNDPVSEVEVIHNGRVIRTILCSAARDQELTATVPVGPGWFLVRAIADVDHTFRFASTAPWYVESRPDQAQRRSGKTAGASSLHSLIRLWDGNGQVVLVRFLFFVEGVGS